MRPSSAIDGVLFLNDAVAVVLKERLPPDPEELTEEKRETIRTTALSRRRTETLEAYRTLLRQRAEILINPAIIGGAG